MKRLIIYFICENALSTEKESLVELKKSLRQLWMFLKKKLISNFRDFGSELFIPCQLYFGSDKSFFGTGFICSLLIEFSDEQLWGCS